MLSHVKRNGDHRIRLEVLMKFLILDIGAGTLDILFYDSESGIHYKAVAKSPIKRMVEKISGLDCDILITGKEMGGGSIGSAIKRLISAGHEVIISASASLTIHHNQEKIRAMGLKIVDDREAQKLKTDKRYHHLYFTDIEIDRIRQIVEGLGTPFAFDVVGICAQDHGMPPDGISHLEFRHQIFKRELDAEPRARKLLWSSEEVPRYLNRLRSIAHEALKLPAKEVYVMDSGMAAISGAILDPYVQSREQFIIVDVATSHTLGATIKEGKIAGFFEYHTSDITRGRLESLIIDLAFARISHEMILQEGGHGAYIREAIGFDENTLILATGPKRDLLKEGDLSITFGSPLGDNMMTGTAGLLQAIMEKINKGD
jgi:uncharacterized protein (DUF1786 family)